MKVHTTGSIRGWMQLGTQDKWLHWDPYQESYDLWAVQDSTDEPASFFNRYLKDEINDWENTPHVHMASLAYGDKDAIYPMVEERIAQYHGQSIAHSILASNKVFKLQRL
jgi:hypothetical protein